MTLRTTFLPLGNSKQDGIEKGWEKAGFTSDLTSGNAYNCIGYNKLSDSFLIYKTAGIYVTKDFKTIIKTLPVRIAGLTSTKIIAADSDGNCNILNANNELETLANSQYSIFLNATSTAENPNNNILAFGSIGLLAGYTIYSTSNLKSLNKLYTDNYSDALIGYVFFNPEDEYIYFCGQRTKENKTYPKKTKDGINVENSSIPPIFSKCLSNTNITYLKNKVILYGHYNNINYFRSASSTFGNYSELSLPDMKGTLIERFESCGEFHLLLGKNIDSNGKTTSSVLYYTKDMNQWTPLLFSRSSNDIVVDMRYFKDRFIIFTQSNQIFYKII